MFNHENNALELIEHNYKHRVRDLELFFTNWEFEWFELGTEVIEKGIAWCSILEQISLTRSAFHINRKIYQLLLFEKKATKKLDNEG